MAVKAVSAVALSDDTSESAWLLESTYMICNYSRFNACAAAVPVTLLKEGAMHA